MHTLTAARSCVNAANLDVLARRGRLFGALELGPLQIDHDVRHRYAELLARTLDHARLEPVRSLGRMSRDQHLLGAEAAQLVLERRQRPVRADFARDREALPAGPTE